MQESLTNRVICLLKVEFEDISLAPSRMHIKDNFMKGKDAIKNEAPFNKGRLVRTNDPVCHMRQPEGKTFGWKLPNIIHKADGANLPNVVGSFHFWN
jgi:hypothetical protein